MDAQILTAKAGRMEVALVSKDRGGDVGMVVEFNPMWFQFWLPKSGTFRGSVTVWHNTVTGRRCPTWLELRLSDCYDALMGAAGGYRAFDRLEVA